MTSPGEPRIVVRAARADDAACLHDLQADIYREDAGFVGDGPPSRAALARRLQALDPAQSCVLLALRGEALCGWLELHRLVPRRLRHVGLLTLAVAPRWRRQGVARALMEGAYRWSGDVGVEKISLNVRASNAAALRLYEREGFVTEGRERRHIRLEEGYEDNLVMAKFVGEPRA